MTILDRKALANFAIASLRHYPPQLFTPSYITGRCLVALVKHSVYPCPKTLIVQQLNLALLQSWTNSGVTNVCIPLCWLCKKAATSGKRGFSNILNHHTCFLSKWQSELVFFKCGHYYITTIFKKSLGTKCVTSRVSKFRYVCLKKKMSCFFTRKEGMFRSLPSHRLLCLANVPVSTLEQNAPMLWRNSSFYIIPYLQHRESEGSSNHQQFPTFGTTHWHCAPK